MKYLIIAKINNNLFGGETSMTFTIQCKTTNEAIGKVLKYCCSSGYLINEIKVVENDISFDLGNEETFWLQVEMFRDEWNGYAQYEYEVPINWLEEHVDNLDEFIEEYTSDETTGLYETAQRDGVILNERWIED